MSETTFEMAYELMKANHREMQEKIDQLRAEMRMAQSNDLLELMNRYQHPNEIVRRLQAGETLVCVGYEDGSYWYELGDHHFDHDDDPALGKDIDLAEQAGLIQEVRVYNGTGKHRDDIVLTEAGKLYGKDWNTVTPDDITLKNGDTLNIQYRTDGEQIDPDSVVVRKNPPSAKFKVNDRVQVKWWPDNTLEEWKAGTILTVYEAHWDNVNGYWSYIVSDDIIVRGTTEDNLELFKE